jgi:hypothetical protein
MTSDSTNGPSTFAELREQFNEECVLHTLSKARDIDQENPPAVLFLDEETGRVHRVLDATRGSPDSGWFVLALGGSHPSDGYERQLRVHDSDTHRVLIESDSEGCGSHEPTPADDVLMTGDGPVIMRVGEPPISIGAKDREDDE